MKVHNLAKGLCGFFPVKRKIVKVQNLANGLFFSPEKGKVVKVQNLGKRTVCYFFFRKREDRESAEPGKRTFFFLSPEEVSDSTMAFLRLVAVVLAVHTLLLSKTSGELLENGDFESLTNWTCGGFTCTLTDTAKRSGQYGVAVSGR